MRYNINFCILSALYLSITAVFFHKQARVMGRRLLFTALLRCSMLWLALDIAVAAMDGYSRHFPSWAVYAANMLLLLTAQTTGALFFFYWMDIIGVSMRAGALLPFGVVSVLLLASPFTRLGIFCLDANNAYCRGAAHAALYAPAALYLPTCLAAALRRRRELSAPTLWTMVSFLPITATAMLVQLADPYLLVSSMANALSVTLVYFTLEAPAGTLDRAALPPMLRGVFAENERCTLLLYSPGPLHLAEASFGAKDCGEAPAAFAGRLKKAYPKRDVFCIDGDMLCVLLRGGKRVDEALLGRLHALFSTRIAMRARGPAPECPLFCVNSEDCADAADMLGLTDMLLRHKRCMARGGALLVDAAFRARLARCDRVERATLRALDDERVEVDFQPIHDASGRLCALEALLRVSDPELGPLPTQELVELAERNGSILRLGEQVLRRTCAFISEHGVGSWGLDHVGVNLSAVQCVQKELPEQIGRILAEYSVPPGLVAFEVTETACGALTALRAGMERISELGGRFLLDDFGTGYANFRSMTALPYRCIKLDRSLLWNAGASARDMSLLTGVIRVVRTLGLTCICEGVETKEQAALLASLGATMLQGYYFSRPLSPAALVEYARNEGAAR